jgi:hypothetical protein
MRLLPFFLGAIPTSPPSLHQESARRGHSGSAPFDPAPFDLAQDGRDRQHRLRPLLRSPG